MPADSNDERAPRDDHARRTIRDEDGRLSPAFAATLIAVPAMILAGFITFALLRPDPTTPLDAMPAAPDAARACAPLMAALPAKLGDYGHRSVSGTTARWRSDNGDSVVLRCGVARPAGLEPSSRLQVVDAAQWFITDEQQTGVAYVAVDHRPYVALWLPRDSGPAPISETTALIDKTLARAPLELR
ncbi:MAG: DUF3515 domain-containing protein [Gordonia sp. (in: high G+C Gram-positive bacteria)]|uniref:DUF3515 domain-containing protein n=1 Tax=Gordonia sp. (in: high G+C Gram-positive bacteria) TaxID=84139 RepID=UPI0039E3B673